MLTCVEIRFYCGNFVARMTLLWTSNHHATMLDEVEYLNQLSNFTGSQEVSMCFNFNSKILTTASHSILLYMCIFVSCYFLLQRYNLLHLIRTF